MRRLAVSGDVLGDGGAGQRRGLRHRRADHASSSGSSPPRPAATASCSSAKASPTRCAKNWPAANPERTEKRTSLTYFGQLSDFQLADEESPARLEIIDPLSTPLNLPFGAAWRPWEALEPQIDDSMIRQIDQFTAASPVANGNGSHSPMDFTIDTGDSADNQQLNETEWVRTLLEGGTLNPNSGVDKKKYSNLLCPNLLVPGAAEAARYTGVQDYNDYFEGTFPEFYDPNSPQGPHAAWPKYPGLMDKAQQSFTAAGLNVPSYVAFGNHDALVQGNAAANAAFEAVATGCLKPIGPVPNPENAPALLTSLLNPTNLLSTLLTNPKNLIIVPGDPKRQSVSKKQFKEIFKAARRPTATASTTSNRPRKRPRKAPPATTPGARTRGCASSPSTPSPRRARSSPRPANSPPTATSTTPSSNG